MASTGHEPPRLLVAPLTRLPCEPDVVRLPLERAFGVRVEIAPLAVELKAAYSLQRNQLNSTTILKMLLSERPDGVDRVLGLVDQDLFIPILTYVFGEAQLRGVVAVASTFRLREPWEAGGTTRAVLEARLIKTALHELAHTYGLRHCMRPRCVMTVASSLEMLDEKAPSFCLQCQGELHDALVGLAP
ncbi:MAG: peptidase M54 [Deltaproteobacteria bacterium]|nr:MAG: peptidase M54 [Deltaproteobacteria bacterium]